MRSRYPNRRAGAHRNGDPKPGAQFHNRKSCKMYGAKTRSTTRVGFVTISFQTVHLPVATSIELWFSKKPDSEPPKQDTSELGSGIGKRPKTTP
ncbi:hypothetical protein AVEN_145195-1 [Araneus ventricosus]|uniref:Uncharacterized protein n=1 Tax=Araneus ventricosus TaxID=182803 RepID=A0A4Y2Q7Z1_ARAVE|nr:hypothetical protein AVEN_145195-1 [Araneus ventricosus]